MKPTRTASRAFVLTAVLLGVLFGAGLFAFLWWDTGEGAENRDAERVLELNDPSTLPAPATTLAR